MTPKEQLLSLYRHEPVKAPFFMDCCVLLGQWSANEQGQRGEEVRDLVQLDSFGCEWYMGDRAPVPLPGCTQLDDICDWREKVVFPEPKAWDWESMAAKELESIDREQMAVMFLNETGCFERLIALMGMEDAMVAMMEDPEECMAFFERVADYKIELIEVVGEYFKPDIFSYADDIAAAQSLFIPASMYREQLKEVDRRIVKAIHDNGMYADRHCCGKPQEVIGDFVDVEFDSWLPGQPQNDIAQIIREYGDKLVVLGGYDSQGKCAIDSAPDEEILDEGIRCAEEYAPLGSFAALPVVGLSSGGQPTPDEIRHIVKFREGFVERCQELNV